MASACCRQCSSTNLVSVRQDASIVCEDCGLVAEMGGMDDRAEWCKYAEDLADPSRVGDSRDLHANHVAQLRTWIAPCKSPFMSYTRLQQLNERCLQEELDSASKAARRLLSDMMPAVESVCRIMDLPSSVEKMTRQIIEDYRMATGVYTCRGPRQRAALVAACVTHASRLMLPHVSSRTLHAIPIRGIECDSATFHTMYNEVQAVLAEQYPTQYRQLLLIQSHTPATIDRNRLHAVARMLGNITEIPEARGPAVRALALFAADALMRKMPTNVDTDSMLAVLIYVSCVLLDIKITRSAIEHGVKQTASAFCATQRVIQQVLTDNQDIMGQLKTRAAELKFPMPSAK